MSDSKNEVIWVRLARGFSIAQPVILLLCFLFLVGLFCVFGEFAGLLKFLLSYLATFSFFLMLSLIATTFIASKKRRLGLMYGICWNSLLFVIAALGIFNSPIAFLFGLFFASSVIVYILAWKHF